MFQPKHLLIAIILGGLFIPSFSWADNTDDIINLMMAAEGHFGNSMARRQVLYLQIDAAVLVKFNDQIVTIMNRLRFNG